MPQVVQVGADDHHLVLELRIGPLDESQHVARAGQGAADLAAQFQRDAGQFPGGRLQLAVDVGLETVQLRVGEADDVGGHLAGDGQGGECVHGERRGRFGQLQFPVARVDDGLGVVHDAAVQHSGGDVAAGGVTLHLQHGQGAELTRRGHLRRGGAAGPGAGVLVLELRLVERRGRIVGAGRAVQDEHHLALDVDAAVIVPAGGRLPDAVPDEHDGGAKHLGPAHPRELVIEVRLEGTGLLGGAGAAAHRDAAGGGADLPDGHPLEV